MERLELCYILLISSTSPVVGVTTNDKMKNKKQKTGVFGTFITSIVYYCKTSFCFEPKISALTAV